MVNNTIAHSKTQLKQAPENVDQYVAVNNKTSGQDPAAGYSDSREKNEELVQVSEIPKYNFCHLHRHCEGSIQDGVGKVEEGIQYAWQMRHPAVAITDHGSLISYVRFWNEAKLLGIKHIFGLEAYLCDDLTKKDKDHKDYNHCTILVKNQTGYQNILKLNNISHRDGFYYRPRIDWDTLFRHKEGLIVLSGCVVGRTCQYILSNRYDDADSWTRIMRGQFGEDYYIETMVSDFPEQKKCNEYLLEISRKYNIPAVVTGDAHYTKEKDYIAQQAMMLLSQKATIADLEKQQQRNSETQEEKDRIWIFDSKQYWMKNEKEMIDSWQKWHSEYYPFNEFESHLNESGKIAEKVELVDLDTSFKVPKADLPEGTDHDLYLTELTRKLLREKNFSDNDEYTSRLQIELDVIIEKGLTDYFIITSDIIRWAKANDVFVGPGRGSAGGSLVCYLLGITEINPLEHGLLFERFLDLGRVELPDIDTDFEVEKRDAVKEYIAQRYGSNNVANVSAFGTFRAKNIVRDIARIYGKDIAEVNILSKAIPEDAEFYKGQLWVNNEKINSPIINDFFESNPQIKEIANTLFGQIRHVSKHAAGVIVTGKPLDECVATFNVGGEIMTAWSEGLYRKELSQLNVLKLDILGLKTLTIIKKTCALVGLDYRKLMELDVNEYAVYEFINRRNFVVGIFQFDSNTGAWLFGHMEPKNFNDLIALGALDRPGPLDSGMAFEYIDEGMKKKTVGSWKNPIITEVLKETYGVIVYQEQLMFLAKELSGFTAMEASNLRKNLVKGQHSEQAKKKQNEEREKIKKHFVEGAQQNGCDETEAEELWDNMVKFARYGFNKAHAVGYAYITYWTMWLKAHYPLEFYTSLLTYANEEDFPEILYEMRQCGIDLLPPDINKSNSDFTADKDRQHILYGLNKVKFLGTKAQEAIIQNRPFTSLDDVLEKIPKNIFNKRSKEALIRTDGFRSFEEDTGKLLTDLAKEAAKKKDKDSVPNYFYGRQEKINDQLFYLGVNLEEQIKPKARGYHVQDQYKHYLKTRSKTYQKAIEIFNRNSGPWKDPKTFVEFERFCGYISSVKETVSKTGNEMVWVELQLADDTKMKFPIMKWDKLYKQAKELEAGSPIGIMIHKRNNVKDFMRIVQIELLKIPDES